jgi:mRNA-degrading endonuclease toxin of MazEF toxin-antitoxin module
MDSAKTGPTRRTFLQADLFVFRSILARLMIFIAPALATMRPQSYLTPARQPINKSQSDACPMVVARTRQLAIAPLPQLLFKPAIPASGLAAGMAVALTARQHNATAAAVIITASTTLPVARAAEGQQALEPQREGRQRQLEGPVLHQRIQVPGQQALTIVARAVKVVVACPRPGSWMKTQTC